MSEQILHQILDKLGSIEDEQKSMRSELQSMKSEVQSVKDTQELMQTQLSETNSIVRAICARHEKILEKLALRSIEQEVDIRDIKLAK